MSCVSDKDGFCTLNVSIYHETNDRQTIVHFFIVFLKTFAILQVRGSQISGSYRNLHL